MTNKSEFASEVAQKSRGIRVEAFRRPLDIEVRLGYFPTASQCSERASYKPLYTRRVTVGAKQGLTNQCRRRGIGHSFFAAHGRNRFRPTRRGVTVWRRATTACIPPQRQLSASRLSLVAHGCRAYRGYGGPPGRQHPNDRATKMADRKVTHSFHRRSADAQPALQSQQAKQEATDPTSLTRQRRAHRRIRHISEQVTARCRECETSLIRCADDDGRTGPRSGTDTRDSYREAA